MIYTVISDTNNYDRGAANVDDRKLEVLIAAVEEGSFNKAAQRCHCTQSAITQLVNAAESELGCKLVSRSHAGVALTEAGEALMPDIRAAYDALTSLRQSANGITRRKRKLRVGSYASVAATWLPRAIAAFRQAEPGVSVDVSIGSRSLADRLVQQEIDLAICDDWLFEDRLAGNGDWNYRVPQSQSAKRDYSWVPLMDEPLLAVAPYDVMPPSQERISRDDLFEHPYIFDANFVYSEYLTSKVTSLVKVSADEGSTILSMVSCGLGITVLPELSLQNVPEGVSVAHLDPPAKRTLGVAVPRDADPLCQRFARHLSSMFEGAES